LKSSGQSVGRRMIYGGKDLWNRCVLSLEWKREEYIKSFADALLALAVEGVQSLLNTRYFPLENGH